MKMRLVKFTSKGKSYEYNVATFETIKDAQALLGPEIINVLNLGNSVYARAQALGKNPFKPRKTKFKIDSTKLDEATLQKLRDLGALS